MVDNMLIAVDGYEANTKERVGIGSYAYETIKGFASLQAQKQYQHLSFRVYLPQKPLSDLPKEHDYWQYKVKSPQKFWTFGALPMSLMLDNPKPSVVFSPTHYMPRFVSYPRVISIMDLSFLYFPELFRSKDLHQLVHWTKYSVMHAKAICTISNFSRNDILTTYHIPEERVFVTYPGFRMHTTQSSVSHVKKKYSLDKPFILSVGTIQPRKNYSMLIEAFSELHSQNEWKEYQLVIVGKKGWLYEDILAQPERLNISESVKFLDFVDDDDLSLLYQSAECFVLPSLYEGFGLPVLEAMANKLPVVVSDVSSLPEIAGDAGIYIDPKQKESIANGIEKALKEKHTEKGKARIRKGIERMSLFSWDSAAKQTLDILEQVGKKEL